MRWSKRKRVADTLAGHEPLICRHGHEHTGEYALYDYGHCQCDHTTVPRWRMTPVEQEMCPDCGEVFDVTR